jgi:hypothetical protein
MILDFVLLELDLVDEFDDIQVPILRNVNFSIFPGEVVAVVSFLLKFPSSRSMLGAIGAVRFSFKYARECLPAV